MKWSCADCHTWVSFPERVTPVEAPIHECQSMPTYSRKRWRPLVAEEDV